MPDKLNVVGHYTGENSASKQTETSVEVQWPRQTIVTASKSLLQT